MAKKLSVPKPSVRKPKIPKPSVAIVRKSITAVPVAEPVGATPPVAPMRPPAPVVGNRQKTVIQHRLNPTTTLSHVSETSQLPGSRVPVQKHRINLQQQVGPNTVVQHSREVVRPVAPAPRVPQANPNTNLRFSGHPNAFRFGRRVP